MINLNDCNSLPYHVYLKDHKGIYLECNDLQAKNIGFHKGSDVVGLTDFDLCWESEEAAHMSLNDQTVLNKQTPIFFMEYITLSHGKMMTGLSYKSPFFSHTGKLLGILGKSFIQEEESSPINFLNDITMGAHKNNSFYTGQHTHHNLSKRQAECKQKNSE